MNAHTPIPVLSQDAADLLNLVLAIRDNLQAAGISPFSDIPELARAYSMSRIAAEIARPALEAGRVSPFASPNIGAPHDA